MSNPDFILELDNFLSKEESSFFIDFFDRMDGCGYTSTRMKDHGIKPHSVSDTQLFLTTPKNVGLDGDLSKLFFDRFWSYAYTEYAKKYSIILDSPSHKIYNLKIQKIDPGEGYHIWHYESSSRPVYNRLLFFIVYLNTIDDGGETEFLYYRKRIRPEVGKFIMSPCGFTHTHRGNPPLKDTKYILTGWVEYE
jgi:hypothetical protein